MPWPCSKGYSWHDRELLVYSVWPKRRGCVGYRGDDGLLSWGDEMEPGSSSDLRVFFQKSMASTTSSPRSSSYANKI